jgi:hypothetical protein
MSVLGKYMKRYKEEGVITGEEFKQEIDREAKRLFGKKPYPAEEPLPEELAEAELHQAKKEREERERWEAFLGEPTEEVEEEPKEKVAEKPKEQILEEARQSFARLDLEAERYVKAQKKLGQQKSKDDFEGYKEAKEAYLKTLKNYRAEMYEQAVREVEKLGLPEKKADKEFKKRMEEIVRETIVREANRLYDQKMSLKLEAKGEPSQIEKIWNFAGRVVEKYRKMPLKYKLMISGGLFAGGIAAGAVGGASGAALITGLATGRWFQRVLGGAATGVGLEALIKRSQEKKTEKKTLAELAAKNLAESIKKGDKKLDEKLLKLEGSKKKQKYWRYTLAGTMGALIGSGLAAKAFHNIFDAAKDIWTHEETARMIAKTGVSGGSIETTYATIPEPTPEAPIDFIETAQKGDSIWKMAEDQLTKHYGEKFTGLDQARKIYVIDAIKDKIAANPQEFGLGDIDKMEIGQKIDFSSIFEDKAGVNKIFEHSEALKQAAIDNIGKNSQILENWAQEHPGEKLTSGKIEEILSAHKVTPTPEAPTPEAPSAEMNKAAMEALLNNESRNIEALGFNPSEYDAIKDLKVGKLLEEIPSKVKAWEIWRGAAPGNIDLPHDGIYGVTEFHRHIKLAEFIRNFKPNEYMKQMTIRQFLRMAGPEGQMTI